MAGNNFDLQSTKRIVAAVKKVEAMPTDYTGSPNPSVPPGTTFWAQLTGVSGNGYSWKKMRIVNGVLVPMDPIIEDTSFTAREANGGGATTGENVLLTFVGYDTTQPGNPPAYIFTAGGSLPEGQYQNMFFGQISDNQTGFNFVPFHAMA